MIGCSLLLSRVFPYLVVTVASLGIGVTAFGGGLQFEEQSASRFPQPDPDDYTNQLSIADVDGDGDLDIVFANGGNFSSQGTPERVRLYINDGTGVFTDESTTRLGGIGGNFRGVEFGDVDGDGDLDMVLANDFQQLPALLINDGAGFFTNESADRLPGIELSSTRVAFGDIDNDGDLDLYFTKGGSNRFGCGQNQIYVNDGAGFFTDETESRHPLGNVCEPMDAIFGDIDGDLDLDIRTASTSNNASKLYRNDGTGVFTDISSGVPSDSDCYSYDFGDVDGDGDLDLLGANAGPSLHELLLLNNGDGTYTDGSSQISPNLTIDDNDSKFFDYDNDGDLDLIIARLFSTSEAVYNNDGHGNFTQVSGIITSISDATLDIGVGDLDGDGDLDIVTAQGESGNFDNRIYINTTGPADTIAPTIVRMEQLPDTDDAAGPYVVRAAVADQMTSDRNFFDKGIILSYSVDAGPVEDVPMRWSGGQVYRGEIPGQPGGGTIEYFVMATDFADNTGIGESKSFTVTADPGDCEGDANGDGVVDPLDSGFVLARFGCPVGTGDPSCDAADQNGDGLVDPLDSGFVLARFGPCD
ncbi:MAG: VCBS repeat-containing protein [Planctomycetes bacterium]|nr:VCBS repeat-containing protein [Planctomycetota bacterium]